MLKAIHILPGADECVEMKNKAGHLWPGGKKKKLNEVLILICDIFMTDIEQSI